MNDTTPARRGQYLSRRGRLVTGTLGVTWSTSGIDEADMAINTRYAWNTGCRAVSGSFDLESVFLQLTRGAELSSYTINDQRSA